MVIGPHPQWSAPPIQAQMPFCEALPALLAWPLSSSLGARLRIVACCPPTPVLQQPVAFWCALTYPTFHQWREDAMPREVAWALRGIGPKKLGELQTVLGHLLAGDQPQVPTVADNLSALQQAAPRKLAMVREVLAYGHSMPQTARRYGCSVAWVRAVVYQTCARLNPTVFHQQRGLAALRAHHAAFGLEGGAERGKSRDATTGVSAQQPSTFRRS